MKIRTNIRSLFIANNAVAFVGENRRYHEEIGKGKL